MNDLDLETKGDELFRLGLEELNERAINAGLNKLQSTNPAVLLAHEYFNEWYVYFVRHNASRPANIVEETARAAARFWICKLLLIADDVELQLPETKPT